VLKWAKEYSIQVVDKIYKVFTMSSQRIHCTRFTIKYVQNIGTLILSLM
jgi:hypothetical protein